VARRRLRIALALTALAAAWAAHGPPAAGQSDPPCPPGTAPLPVPTPEVARGAPGGAVAGRPFRITYREAADVVVEDTLLPPGASFPAGGDGSGWPIEVLVAAPGPAVLTVRYRQVGVAEACLQSASFTVSVRAPDPVRGPIGYAEGATTRFIGGFRPLPRRGATLGGPPLAGVTWECDGTLSPEPVVAELRTERALRRRPSASSPAAVLTLPDPCEGVRRAAAAAGARITAANIFDATWALGVEHRARRAGRHWLRVTQGGRLVGQLRYYVAFRAQRGRFADTWVIVREPEFERARCRRRDRATPIGTRAFPLPPCPR
jgi:hypothetical protein